jgi:hypothetical protein
VAGKVRYKVDDLDEWLETQRENPCHPTNKQARDSGGVGFKSPAKRSADPRARRIGDKLRLKSGGCVPSTNPRHLIAVSEEA